MKLVVTLDVKNPGGKRTPKQELVEEALEQELDNVELWFGDDQYTVTVQHMERAER